MYFTRRGLEQAGFVGWVSFLAVRGSACPSSGGVYVITYSGGNPISFAERSCGGWFKGKDPTVPREALIANWVDGAEVVHIGKADQLKRRLTQFADFGAGKPIGHGADASSGNCRISARCSTRGRKRRAAPPSRLRRS
jgi:hypothetical protein